MNLEEQFQQAAKDVQTLPKKPDNPALLKLYSLYKQGSVGELQGKRPGVLSLVARAKYDAWAELKGMSQDQAKKDYVGFVKSLMAGS